MGGPAPVVVAVACRGAYATLVTRAGALLADRFREGQWGVPPGQGWLASRAVLVPPYPHDPRPCPACADYDWRTGEGRTVRCEMFVKYGGRAPGGYPQDLRDWAGGAPGDAARAARAAWDVAARAAAEKGADW